MRSKYSPKPGHTGRRNAHRVGRLPAAPLTLLLMGGLALLLACASGPTPRSSARRLSSYQLQSEREQVIGELTTVSGYLISAGTVGENYCFKLLVDETLPFGPELLISQRGWATEPPADLKAVYHRATPRRSAETGSRLKSEPSSASDTAEEAPMSQAALLGWMSRLLPQRWSASLPAGQRLEATSAEAPADPKQRSHSGATSSALVETAAQRKEPAPPDLGTELTKAESYLEGSLSEVNPRRAAVIQACRRPPTRANKKALKNALEWLAPMLKSERIESAPTLSTLRRELQLFYLERSRNYGWASLAWEEVALTGILLGPEEIFEEEVLGGVDMVPYVLGVHDPQRDSWLFLDLNSGDSYSKELFLDVLRNLPDRMVGKARDAALRGGLP